MKVPRIGTKLRVTLQLTASMALFAFLISRLDWQRSLVLIRGAEPLLLATIVLIQSADRVLMALKWKLLLHVLDHRLGAWGAIRVYYESTLIGYALPLGGLGPDIVRFVRLRGCGINPHVTLASIVMERAIGAVATLVFIFVGFVVLAQLAPEPQLMRFAVIAAWCAALGAVLAIVLIFHAPTALRLIRVLRLESLIRSERFGKYTGAARSYSARPGVLVVNLMLSMIEQTAPLLTMWVASHALGTPVPWVVCLAVAPVAVIVQRLPVTYAGLGLREGSAAALLVALGYGYSEALLLLMTVTVMFLISLVPGAIILAMRGRPRLEATESALPLVQTGAVADESKMP